MKLKVYTQDNKIKIINDFQVFKFRVIVVESIPNIVFDKVKINGQIYERVPTSDMKNCVVFLYDGNDTFLNCEVEFIL